MGYSNKLRELFPEISMHIEDLLLLETFQIKNLPERVSHEEFATLLRANPVVHRFLVSKYPPIASYLDKILLENSVIEDKSLIEEQCQETLWEIADLIIYNKYPERFDTQAPIKWEPDEISPITSFEGRVIADVGAGTGRIAFMVAPLAQTVFAIEPVSSFRSFIKEKALREHTENIFVMDGTLDSIPLPNHSLDVLLTSNAIGWNLPQELKEIERVVKPGGHAFHLLWAKELLENPFHETLTSAPWNYSCIQNESQDEIKINYSRKF